MRKFNFFCSIVIVLSLALSIVTLGQNVTMRTASTYTFYFNDTSVVGKVTSDYTNSEMSDEIVGFLNSWRPKEFQITEDTGYDMEGIFDAEESDNMLAIKKAADISLIFCIISIIITVAIYVYFIKNNFKEVLKKRIAVASGISVAILIVEMILIHTKNGISFLTSIVGIEALDKNSSLQILLGGNFIDMAGNFLFAYTIILCLAVIYVNYVFTRSPRIFH